MAGITFENIQEIAVYPGIGVARVGDAPDGFWIGPEVPAWEPRNSMEFRDKDGRILRQAARFRVYARLTTGQTVEITSQEAQIEWRVEIANLKAGWYEFNNAMDLPNELVKPSNRRNAALKGAQRDALDIRPAPVVIAGRNKGGPTYRFSTGKFFTREVTLGELNTDDAGRLIFLAGSGSSNPRDEGTRPTTFANNDLWHDDIADGPVRARLTIGDKSMEAKPGYVVTAPPNFAPGLRGVVTMDDVVRDVFIRELGWLNALDRPSFSNDIWPIFDRMTALQWVNHGSFVLLGHGSPLDAKSPHVINQLADNSQTNLEFRQGVFALFRDPDQQLGPERTDALPPIYGDGYGEYPELGVYDLPLTRTMYAALRQWRDGDFESDWKGFPSPSAFHTLSPDKQCEALNRAALEDCLGGPFHPGIELTWTLRWPNIWYEPYRLKLLPEGQLVKQEYGEVLTRESCLDPDGPISVAGPGALTRWLGVPWQTDEASCNSGSEYEPSRYLSVPSFWSARVPNAVLSEQAVERILDPQSPPTQRWKHFNHRLDWTRDINGRNYFERIANMVTDWSRIGIVTPMDFSGDAQIDALPHKLHVERGRDPAFVNEDPTLELARVVENPEKRHEAMTAGVAPDSLRGRRQPARTFGRGEV